MLTQTDFKLVNNKKNVLQAKREIREISQNPYRTEIIRNTVIKQISSYQPKFNCKIKICK